MPTFLKMSRKYLVDDAGAPCRNDGILLAHK